MTEPNRGLFKRLYHDYRSMLKPLEIESWPDLFIYRPLAFGLVKLIRPLPITPNQISIFAIAVGLGGGICLAYGTPTSFKIAGILFLGNVILDCSDGMLARSKKNGTPFGRIVDGLVDYFNGGAIFIGMAIGLSRSGFEFSFPLAVLIILSLASWAGHSMAVDYARREFMRHALGVQQSLTKDRKKFITYRHHLRQKPGRWPEKILANIYLFYCGMQKPYEKISRTYPAQRYYKFNKPVMRGWLLIDPAAHMTIVILSAILYNPHIFFWYTIVIANILLLMMYAIQYFINKKVGAIPIQ